MGIKISVNMKGKFITLKPLIGILHIVMQILIKINVVKFYEQLSELQMIKTIIVKQKNLTFNDPILITEKV